MNSPILNCRGEDRRKHLFGNPNWNGIDFLEVREDQQSLCVHFFGRIPDGIMTGNIRIDGGARVRDIRAVRVVVDHANDAELDDCLRIVLDKTGDFSTYRLCLVERVKGEDGCTVERPLSGLDPRYACLSFSFKADCPSDLDCKREDTCEPAVPATPAINLLAKDYASFRSLILDRLALTMPDWKERHVPDIGIVLVELLAYVGDRLSYYQDAVATEAYLETARRRISVRRHARLVDYTMHEGCNARAFVSVETDTDLQPMNADEFYFITGFPSIKAGRGRVVAEPDLERVPSGSYESYEPLTRDGAFTFRAAHTRIAFHTWGDSECCLPKGTTHATLVDGRPDNGSALGKRVLTLEAGDFLIFEEVRGPGTGAAGDADPTQRHAVRLTKATQSRDELLGQNIVEIDWALADALPISLCLSARLPSPDCRRVENISVARGNIVLVDHGSRATATLGPVGCKAEFAECACEGSVTERTIVPAKFEPALPARPLAFAERIHDATPAAGALVQDPRKAVPAIALREHQADGKGVTWSPRADLLGSGPDDRHFVAEIDDDGTAQLRFGDGDLGRSPESGTVFDAAYRVGGGPTGNTGRDTITYMVLGKTVPQLSGVNVAPRNPLPAVGGTAPETAASVKLLAPTAFRARRERAITADDYAEIAGRHAGVQRAAAELCWMGSWYAADVYTDPTGTESADPDLLADIDRFLQRYRRIGHDLEVDQACYVPLDVALHVCVKPHYARGAVKAELIKLFGTGTVAGGKLAFFHPDNLSFGGGIQVSRMIALARGIEGVQDITVNRLDRLGDPESDALESGILRMGAFEVARCDSDPNFPENGRIEFVVEGGR